MLRIIVASCLIALLAGCGETGGGVSRAFVTPRKYDHLDCKQLQSSLTATKSQMTKSDELYDKGGLGLGFMVYGPDVIRQRGEVAVLEQAIAEKGCQPG